MRVYVGYMDEKTVDAAFCRGLLLVHDGKFDEAFQVLDTARRLMYTEVSALVGESYERAYKSVVKAQQVMSAFPFPACVCGDCYVSRRWVVRNRVPPVVRAARGVGNP